MILLIPLDLSLLRMIDQNTRRTHRRNRDSDGSVNSQFVTGMRMPLNSRDAD